MNAIAVDTAMPADRRPAGAVEQGQEAPLGGQRHLGVRIPNRLHQRIDAVVVAAGLFIIWREQRLGLPRGAARKLVPPQ